MPKELPALGPFVLDERIAGGGMGEVWRGHHHSLMDVVAIKVLDPKRPPTARAIEALHREVRAIASLDHEAIVRIHDYGELPHSVNAPVHWNHGAPYFVMEYAPGGALHQIAHSLAWPQIRELLLSILSALAHAHSRGVIHRDLKPSNILLRQGAGALDDILISDFGLAYALREEQDERRALSASYLVGTPAYMAPEQIQDALCDLGPWTDLYALGCMAWQLVHDRPPFGIHEQDDVLRGHLHDPLPTWAPRITVPDGLHTWMRSLLAKNPYDRFAFASEAARALTLLDHIGGPVLGLSQHERSVPMPERTHFHDAGLGLYELKPVPLVGRHAERRTLWRAFESMIASQSPHLVVLRGEAGVGKSRLAQWLVERGHELGAALSLSAFHEPNPQAMEVLRRMLNKELRVTGLKRREAQRHITEYVHRWRLPDDTQETITQDIRVLHQLTTPPTREHATPAPPTQLPSWQERQSTWIRLMRRLTHRKALIIWIDDAQWASDMLSLAQELISEGRKQRLPVLIIATLRHEALPEHSIQAQQLVHLIGAAQDAVDDVHISPLPALPHERLIRELLPLSTELINRVVQRTQGNPLFTIQLIGDWVQRGALHINDYNLELNAEELPLLPEDIHQLWRSRVEQVIDASTQSQDVARALQAAAVLGRDIDEAEWRALCKIEELNIPEDLLDKMVHYRLATLTDVGWCFYHEMLRESLLWMADQTLQTRPLHHAAAQMLRARYDIRLPRIAERLAYHEIEAGHYAAAIPLLLTSLHHFRVVGEFYRARHVVRRWEHAIEQVRLPHGDPLQIEGLLGMVHLHITQGDLELAHEALDLTARHAQVSDEISPKVDVLLVRARLQRKRGESTQALDVLTRAFELLKDVEQEPELRGEHDTDEGLNMLEARATMARGEVLASLGRHEQARQHLIQAIQHIKHMDERREELGRGLLVLSEVLYNQHEIGLSKELLAEAIGQFTRQNNQVALAYCHNLQGDMARRVDETEQAHAHYLKARALLHALGSNEAVFPSLNLVFLALKNGHYTEAMRYIPGVREAFWDQGREAYAGMVDLAEASCEWARGEHDSSRQLALRGIHVIDAAGVVEHDTAFLAEHLVTLMTRSGDTSEVGTQLSRLVHTHRTTLGNRKVYE